MDEPAALGEAKTQRESMKRQAVVSLLLALAFSAPSVRAAGGQAGSKPSAAPPSIDKAKLEQYLRFAEAFSPTVKLAIDDPVPTPIRGYFRLLVHLSAGESKQEKTYYLSADGRHVLAGPVWDLEASPFAETAPNLTTSGPSFGPTDARITMVVFSDFQCPYCREFARTIRDNLPKTYPKDVRVVFKDYPITSIHPWAEAGAEAAHCITDAKPDAFWSFHDWIFEHQGEITKENLREKVLGFAKDHSVDPGKVITCFDTHGAKPQVEENLAQGHKLGVEQTPTFFLNGRTVSGAVAWSSLNTLLQMELNRPSFIPAFSGAAADAAQPQPSQ